VAAYWPPRAATAGGDSSPTVVADGKWEPMAAVCFSWHLIADQCVLEMTNGRAQCFQLVREL